MTVRRDQDVIRLEGDCPIEEAEALAALLEGEAGWTVDLSRCRQLHTALVQALARFGPRLQGDPENPFIRDVIVPALGRRSRGSIG